MRRTYPTARHRHPTEAFKKLPVGFDVRDDGSTGLPLEGKDGQDREQLVSLNDLASAVDNTNAVAITITIKGYTEAEVLFCDERLQVLQVLFDRGVGIVVRELAVHLGKQGVMVAGKALDEFLQRRACGAVTSVPSDAESRALKVTNQPVHVAVRGAVGLGHTALTAAPVASSGTGSHPDYLGGENRPAGQHHLKAVVGGRVVAASDLDAASYT